MATRKCKDCGKQVSTRAKQCPHCGAPVKRTSGCLGVIALLFLVFVVIGIISSTVDQEPKPKHSSPVPRVHSPSTSTPSTIPPPKPDPKPTPQPPPEPAPPDWDARREELQAQFLREFKAPQVGSTVSLQLKQGNTMQGVVKSLTDDEIQIQHGPATMGFMKTQLSPQSRIRCFSADYAIFNADAQVARERAEAERAASTPRALISSAEAALRTGDLQDALEALNGIIHNNPQSHEASTVLGLIRMCRQQGLTPYTASIVSCTFDDVKSLKRSLDSMELIAKNYNSIAPDKRAAVDTIFGPATFSNADLSLDGLLNAMKQMDAASRKAVGVQ
jgi:hypothetical protein